MLVATMTSTKVMAAVARLVNVVLNSILSDVGGKAVGTGHAVGPAHGDGDLLGAAGVILGEAGIGDVHRPVIDEANAGRVRGHVARAEIGASGVERLGEGGGNVGTRRAEGGELTPTVKPQRLHLVAAPDHPLAQASRIRKTDLKDTQILSLHSSHHLHRQVAGFCVELGMPLLKDYEGTSL
ncbi:MAG: hypothetical protein EB141_19205, partial [Verrucomicrobia bacterium]|nr:hypothetical protein [Verrucomicrobiota bacterium]